MLPYLGVALVVSWALLILQPPAPVAVARANQFRRSMRSPWTIPPCPPPKWLATTDVGRQGP
jgi:hypothetical protein